MPKRMQRSCCKFNTVIILITKHFKFLFSYSSDKQQYKFAMYSFSLLVNSSTMEEILLHLSSIKVLFHSEYIDEKVNIAYRTLQQAFTELGVKEVADDEELPDEDTWAVGEELERESEPKPFGRYFEERLKLVKTCCDQVSDNPRNPFCKPRFVDIIVHKWLPTCPLWTSLLRGIKMHFGMQT